MTVDVKSLIQEGAELTDRALEALIPSADTIPASIHGAMRHSTFAGGKRLRPVLAMQAGVTIAGGLPKGIEELAAALEMLHTYSLIHDDLPALDNDDLRRGKPTCHVVFGEATAILAGDALQTLAFHTIANLPCFDYKIVRILRDVSAAIGTGVGPNSSLPPGMIGGQVVDIESEGQTPTADLIESIHRAKTGALITTSIVSGGLFGLLSGKMSLGSSSDFSGSAPVPHKDTPEAAREAFEAQHAEGQAAGAKNEDTIARLRSFG